MHFAAFYHTLVAGLLATSINASPYYGINIGSSKLQVRDLFVNQTTTCDSFVYGATNITVGQVCVGITQGILTVAYGPLTDCTYGTVHVYVDTVPPTNRNPGGFGYSSEPGGICTVSEGGATASCPIPVKDSWRVCEQTLYIATHASITCSSGGQTGWGMGTCFGGNTSGNCAKYWMFTTHCYCPTVSVFPQEYRTSTSTYTSTSTTAFLTSTTITYTTSTTSTYTTSTTVTFDTSTTSEYSTTEFPETVITTTTTTTLPLSSTTSTVTCVNPSP